MAEINNSFFQGKMNKDLDERLIPNGQYRDALNIEVSTSDDNDVGTVQAVRGNTKVSGTSSVPTGSSIVGEITDEKNNCIYYFVSGPETNPSSFSASDTQPSISKDLILKYDSSADTMTNVFTDVYSYLAVFDNTTGTDLSFDIDLKTITLPNASTYTDNLATNMYVNIFDTDGNNHVWNNRITNVATNVITLEDDITSLTGFSIAKLILHITHKDEKRALNFNTSYYITGINIVEDFLMWTDNNSEPKKVSVTRSQEGTTNANTSTKLYIDGTTIYPLTTDKRADETHTTVVRKSPIKAPVIDLKVVRTNTSNKATGTLDLTNASAGDIIDVTVSENPFLPNDLLLLDTGSPDPDNFQVKLQVLSLIGDTGFSAKIFSINTFQSSTFNIFLLEEGKKLFDDKFSFFATRFKYIDGEYSTFSPFSNAAFLPGSFEYDKNESFNIGMQNRIREVVLTNIIPSDIPEDVVQVDILYTESNSPEIYKVDTIRKDDDNNTYWNDNKYTITKENIYSLLEEKQLLRQWDNVPRQALAQEIVGNRLVYANYKQNHNLDNQTIDLEAHVDTRKFTSSELIPNPYISESLQGWEFSDTTSFTHSRTKTNNNRTVGHIKMETAASNFDKFYTTDNILTAEEANDTTFFFEFTVFDSDGAFEFKGPFLMSGTNTTGKFTAGITVTGDGDYSGTLTLTSDRSTINTGHIGTNHDDHRHIMFQKISGTGSCKVKNFSLKKLVTSNRESIKSLRNYKLGVVYADEYGRETPVLTGKDSSIDVQKERANNINCIKAKISSSAPTWATHYKYFVKETSSDYNNLALSRVYRSGDNGFYLSFPSSERNKVTEDDFLILKKSHNNSSFVSDVNAKYKVLDISANAPDFIKEDKNSLGVGGSNSNINTDIFDVSAGLPVVGSNRISIDRDDFTTLDNGAFLEQIIQTKQLAYEFKDNNNRVSELYRIDSLELDDTIGSGSGHYVILSETNFSIEDSSWVLASGGSSLNSGVTIEFFSTQVKNKPEFDGHFFVKVHQDATILEEVYLNSTNSFSDQVVANSDSYYLSDSASKAALLTSYSTSHQTNNSFQNGDTTFTHAILANNYGSAGDATNVVVLTDDSSNFDDLSSSTFRDLTGADNPFDTNLKKNDTLFYEALPWHESGEKVTSTAVGDTASERNIYKAIPASFMFATLHINNNTLNISGQVGGAGIFNNAVGENQGGIQNTAGRYKHAAFSYSYGLFQSQDTSGNNRNYSIYGSVGAYMKFARLFKFDQQNQSGGNDLGINSSFQSRWFIDNLSYIGFQPDGDYDPNNGKYRLYHRAVHYEVHNNNEIEMAAFDGTGAAIAFDSSHPPSARNDYERVGRGIYIATTDDFNADTELYGAGNEFHETGSFYMQLSYGGFQNTISPSDFDNQNIWASKGWRDPNEAEFNSIFDQASEGARFRFVDDASNTLYTVQALKIVQRYNHTPFPGDSKTYYQFDQDGGPTHSITFGELRDASIDGTTTAKYRFKARNNHDSNTKFDLIKIKAGATGINDTATIVQDSIVDEEKRFVRGTNRRLTLIMKLDKNPIANFDPRDHFATSVTAGKMNATSSGRVIQFIDSVVNENEQLTTADPAIFETEPKTTEGLDIYYEASDFYDIKDHGVTNRLKYFNCYSFGNGVESNTIKDIFNKPNLGKGIVASTTLDEVYKEDRRGSGLIFSGIYNSTSNVNNLNQFLTAEIITKDVNPTYGTIQKLHTKDSNLLVLCEDKILKILANKDAVFNADGNPQLTANTNVLGQTIPYAGEYGISKDPRSFASQSHRSYFTDKQRGVVLRLSMDGLTTISQYGMADFFRDELPSSTALVGSYDTRKNEYNLKIDSATDRVVSFNENIKGFSSFKSFTDMEAGISLNNNYYTFKSGELYKHHVNDTRANFYGTQYYPELTLILNADPYRNKRFKTITYEGTQAKVDLLDVTANGSDADFYNIEAKTGWYVDDLETDIPQTGTINEFLEKGNKWYNYIKGDAVTASNIDTSDFNVQGLGIITSNTVSS